MSLLTTSKKAITEADAKGVLKQTCALQMPLGANVAFINPDEFWHCCYVAEGIGFSKDLQQSYVADELKPQIDEFLDNTDDWRYSLRTETQRAHLRSELAKTVVSYLDTHNEGIAATIRQLPHHLCRETADRYPSALYEQPLVGFIVTPASHMSRNDEIYRLPDREGFSLPGYNAQWHAKCAWHEIGHAIGGGEPQSDMISAVILGQEFADQRVIKAAADFRAFKNIFPTDEARRQKYNWSIVEANDHVLRCSESTINDLTEEQIRDIRFQKFENISDAVAGVSTKFWQWVDQSRPRVQHYEDMAHQAEVLLYDKDLSDVERRIIARFGLAATRFSYGEEAYDERAEGLINQEFRESEKAEPMTFLPDILVPE